MLDALDVERASWLGYSMGGRAALAFAAAHPERVERLPLVGASAGLADPEARRERIASDEALADRIERDGIEATTNENHPVVSQGRAPWTLGSDINDVSHTMKDESHGMFGNRQDALHTE